jgi:hypothetical protein
LAATLPPARSFGWLPILLAVAAVLAAVGAGIAYVVEREPELPARALEAIAPIVLAHPVLIALLVLAVILVRDARGWALFAAAVAAGSVAIGIAAIVPVETPLGAALHGELPDAAAAWLPWFVAVLGGLGVAGLWARDAWPSVVRAGLCAVIVVAAAVPVRPDVPVVGPSREVPYARTAADAATDADLGAWRDAPDPRALIGPAGAALVDAVRAEQASGAMGASTEIVHVAPAIGAWAATPLASFAGVIETAVVETLPPVIPSDGSRIHPLSALPGLLGPHRPYVVVEGLASGSSPDRDVVAEGYRLRAEGDGWRLYRLDAAG